MALLCDHVLVASAVGRAVELLAGVTVARYSKAKTLRCKASEHLAVVTDRELDDFGTGACLYVRASKASDYSPLWHFEARFDDAPSSFVEVIPYGDVGDDKDISDVVCLFVTTVQLHRFDQQGSGLTVEEEQAVRAVVDEVQALLHARILRGELGAATQASVDSIVAQLRSPAPDRAIIGTALKKMALFAGGLFTGVTANYLTFAMKGLLTS